MHVFIALFSLFLLAVNCSEQLIDTIGKLYKDVLNNDMIQAADYNKVNLFDPPSFTPTCPRVPLAHKVTQIIHNPYNIAQQYQSSQSRTLAVIELLSLYTEFRPMFSDFQSFNDLIEHIECSLLMYPRHPSTDYELFKRNAKFYHNNLDKNFENYRGFLLTVLLLNDSVDESYKKFLKRYCSARIEETFLQCQNRKSVWERFINELGADLEKPFTNACTLEVFDSVLSFLLQNGHQMELAANFRKHDDPKLIVYLWNLVYRKGLPILNLDDFRRPFILSKSNADRKSVGSIDHISALPGHILTPIICKTLDFEDGVAPLVIIPLVCKSFHKFMVTNRVSMIEHVIQVSKNAAMQFIIDCSRRKFSLTNFKLGFPWCISSPDQVMEVLVSVVTTHETFFDLSTLNEYYFRGLENVFKYPTTEFIFEKWYTLLSKILRHHLFHTLAQYLLFTKRCFSRTKSIPFYINKHFDENDAFNCVAHLVQAAIPISLNMKSIIQILESVNAENRSLVMQWMLPFTHNKFTLFIHALSRYHIDRGLSLETLRTIAEQNNIPDIKRSVPDKKYFLQLLSKNRQFLGVWKREGDVKLVIDAIMDGYSFGPISDDWLRTFAEYFFRHRLDPALFEKLIQAIRLTRDQSSW